MTGGGHRSILSELRVHRFNNTYTEEKRREVVSWLEMMKGRDGVIDDSVIAGTQGKKG